MQCKLTNEKGQTKYSTQWGIYVTKEIEPELQDETIGLCSNSWFHYYEDEFLAITHNSSHADFDPKFIQLWEVIPEGLIRQDETKSGCTKLTTVGKIPIPTICTERRIAYAIFCALEVVENKTFRRWATSWLNGKQRNSKAVRALLDNTNQWDKDDRSVYCSIMFDILSAAHRFCFHNESSTANREAEYAAQKCYDLNKEIDDPKELDWRIPVAKAKSYRCWDIRLYHNEALK